MKDILVVGGGFFGLYLADSFAASGYRVTVCEKERDFMQRASFVNQARVHNGYHYPRSILTALRSKLSFPRFCDEFKESIDDSFTQFYMIPKTMSKISANQFRLFCSRIGAPCEPAPYKVAKLANANLIDAVLSTTEYAFNSEKLKEIMLNRLEKHPVKLMNGKVVSRILKNNNRLLAFIESVPNVEPITELEFDHVFNCTYSMINQLNHGSDIELIPLKHELAEMALVDVPEELKNLGVTVMDGPFFSIMPFPAKSLHSFSHVRYTPHFEWHENSNLDYIQAHRQFEEAIKETKVKSMIQDAKRYIPMLSECQYKESIWEVKTILPRSESDDSRPILYKPNYGINGYHCIMGGKIDNVYDAVDAINKSGLLKGHK